jgi:hypothetical protein
MKASGSERLQSHQHFSPDQTPKLVLTSEIHVQQTEANMTATTPFFHSCQQSAQIAARLEAESQRQ